MKKIILISSVFILIYACKSDDIYEIDNVNFKYKELFELSSTTQDEVIKDKDYCNLRDSLSYDDYINFYKRHGYVYLSSYSSSTDMEEMRMASTEYLMSLDNFLLSLKTDDIKQLLCLVLKKQQIKFNRKYSSPERTRETGLFLIVKLLNILKDNKTLSSISDYFDKHTFRFKAYNDEEFNKFLFKIINDKYNCNI